MIAPVKDKLESAGFRVSTVVRHGAPAETLIRIAHDFDASEIVFGKLGNQALNPCSLALLPAVLFKHQISPLLLCHRGAKGKWTRYPLSRTPYD